MDLLRLRRLLAGSKLGIRLTTHARIEAIKDGLTETDLRRTLEQGAEMKIIPTVREPYSSAGRKSNCPVMW